MNRCFWQVQQATCCVIFHFFRGLGSWVYIQLLRLCCWNGQIQIYQKKAVDAQSSQNISSGYASFFNRSRLQFKRKLTWKTHECIFKSHFWLQLRTPIWNQGIYSVIKPPMEKTNLGCRIFTSFVKTYFQAGAVCTSVKGTHMLLPIVTTRYNVGLPCVMGLINSF